MGIGARRIFLIADVRFGADGASDQGRAGTESDPRPRPHTHLKEPAMSTDSHATTQSSLPSYPQRTRTTRAVIAVAAVVVSSTLMVGVLGLFEMRSADIAMGRASAN